MTGPAFLDSRAPEPGGLFVAFAGRARRRSRLRGRRRWRAARPRVLGTRATGVPDRAGRRRPGRAAGAGPRGACVRRRADRQPAHASSRSPARRARPAPRTCSPGCSPTPAPTVATAGSFNNELGLPLTVLRADRRDPLPRAGDGRPRGRPPRPSCARSPRPTSRWCSTSARPTSASSGRRRTSRRPRARSSRRSVPTARPCSTPTTRSCPRWPSAPPARGATFGRAADADVRLDGRGGRRPRPRRAST